MNTEQRFYREGTAAHNAGVPFAQCPYPAIAQDRRGPWSRGWLDARAQRFQTEYRCPCGQQHLCEYTADGADPTPSNPACGRPATVRNPRSLVDFDYDEWYCAQHADPAWTAA